MNEEIREILEEISNDENYSNFIDSQNGGAEYYLLLEKAEGKQLVNYITNLQKENQSLKEKLNCKEYFSSTMPENTEFVILTKENYDRQQKDLALENIILKSRNEKAVENLKRFDIEYLHETYQHDLANEIEFLLNILQGGDEN